MARTQIALELFTALVKEMQLVQERGSALLPEDYFQTFLRHTSVNEWSLTPSLDAQPVETSVALVLGVLNEATVARRGPTPAATYAATLLIVLCVAYLLLSMNDFQLRRWSVTKEDVQRVFDPIPYLLLPVAVATVTRHCRSTA